MRKSLSGLVLSLVLLPAAAQSPKHEFRGAWIATVINLDWPQSSSLPTSAKQAALQGMLDGLQEAGINVVFFQIRTECDAFYDSPFEPWSLYLTGVQGAAPEPFFDPLAFAVEEAHARGLELHAWLNPFRCEREVGRYPLAPGHPVLEHPEWMLTLSDNSSGRQHTIMNPGLDAVHDYVAAIVADVVRRYAVDGIHFDDYFYPYPPYQIGTADLDTFNEDPRGFGSIADWRRDNVNRFVARISQTVAAANPDVVFGISPFGIWRNGVPQGISGLSGADALFADARAWLDAGTIDYLAPQLYWPFGGAQDFAALAEWWVSVSNGRHIYPGLAAYRADPATSSGTPFAPTEVPGQIRFGRDADGIDGHILFRARNITGLETSGLRDTLETDLYARLALPPVMGWRDLFAPDAPFGLRLASDVGDGVVELTWDTGFGFVLPHSFAVYRSEGAPPSDPRAMTLTSEHLIGRSFEHGFTDRPVGEGPFHYVVTALSANRVEGDESEVLTVDGLPTFVAESPDRDAISLYPNPFRRRLWIEVPADGLSLEVYDVLGRRVAPPRRLAAGRNEWVPSSGLAAGVYLFRLSSPAGGVTVRTALLVR